MTKIIFISFFLVCCNPGEVSRTAAVSCAKSSECPAGLTCVDNVCQNKSILGAKSEGEACENASECGPYSICKNGFCKYQSQAGEACDVQDDCKMGLSCKNNLCTL